MKAIRFIGVSLLAVFLVLSCSEEMGEKEYFDLANQYMGQQNWEKAEQNFEIIYQKFPNGVFSSKALFMMGYLNANHLNNLEKARKYYTEFLEKYPNHELADDAKYELENLGKDVEDLPFLKGDEEASPESTSNSEGKVVSAKK